VTRLLLRPRASQDIDEHFLTVAADNPPVAFKLLEKIEDALERIRQNPEIGSPRYAKTARLLGLRM
jgi:plasmid stabilization system protein ParE